MKRKKPYPGPLITDSPEINELIFELSNCRDDDRSNANLLTQFVVAAWTILVAAFTLGQLSGISDKPESKMLFFGLTVAVLSILCGFIVSVGVTSTLRHHYMVHLEDKLTDAVSMYKNRSDEMVQVLHWISLKSTIETLNYKNARSRYSKDYFISRVIAVVSLIILGIGFIFVQLIGMDYSKIGIPEIVFFIVLPLIILMVIVIYGVYTFLYASQNSREYFNYAIFKSLGNWFRRKNSIILKDLPANAGKGSVTRAQSKHIKKKIRQFASMILYFLYPRLKDVQKIIFVIIGFVFGWLSIPPDANGGAAVFNFTILGLTLLITEALIYQARYQWNDIRGLSEDYSDNTKVFNLSVGMPKLLSVRSYIPFIVASLVIMSAKLFLAFYVLMPCYGAQQDMIMYGNIAILVLAVLYEFCRSYKLGTLTILLVGFGYPLRFIIGLLAANPGILINVGPAAIIITISLALFGIAFVTLGWALIIADKPEKILTRRHCEILSKDVRDIKEKYPLMQCDNKLTWWNMPFILSIILLSISQYILDTSIWSVLIAVIPVICSFVYSFYRYKTESGRKNCRFLISIFISVGYIILVLIFNCIYLRKANTGSVYIFIAVMQVFYVVVYNGFRNSHYAQLYDSLPQILRKIKGFIIRVIIKMKECVLRMIIGKKTLAILCKK